MNQAEFDVAIAEYRLHDRAAERALDHLRAAYNKVRDERITQERELMRAVIAVELAGGDTATYAEAALRVLGLPMLMDVPTVPDPKHGFLGNMRYQCDGYCNEQFRRTGEPVQWKVST
jgi:hypothetical protein